jgi:hypothetical protein
MARHGFEIGEPAGVGQAIQIDEGFDAGLINDVMDEVGADEARAAGD